MSKYTFPDLSSFPILYKGRRYIAFSVSKTNHFSGMEEYADFVVWDGLYDAAVSYGVITGNGMYDGFLAFSHVEIEVDSATTISEFVKNSSSAQLQFFKDSGT
jgi:hypothetical protein